MNKIKQSSYDLIIVGAGSGGCSAAIEACKKGLTVCLIDRKPKELIGKKVCGDLIGQAHIKFLENKMRLKYPKDKIECIINQTETINTKNKKSYLSYEKGYMLNRHTFGQFFLAHTKKLGVTIIDNQKVIAPIIKNDFLIGVILKDNDSGNETKIYSKIVIDSSGAISALREKVKIKGTYLENKIKKSDFAVSLRQIRTLKKGLDFTHAKLILSEKYAKSGYIWIFPYSKTKVNVGIGVPIKGKVPNLNNALEAFIKDNKIFDNSKIIDSGGGIIPLRRPLDSMVSNGFMVVGDTASQVNPITGGGIGQSILAGYIAADVAYKAIKKNDFSQEGLWEYNLKFIKFNEYSQKKGDDTKYYNGTLQANLDVVKQFYQSSSEEELEYISNNYLNDDIFKNLSIKGQFSISSKLKIKIIIAIIKKPKIFLKLFNMAIKIKKISKLYKNYPKTPKEFPKWKNKIDKEYQHINKLLN
ncbi:MAG: geranylgeranyl reductase family protein [DPANN group archaeon]|nr:geranylgeranyl reductase family protein [DPANN group archaeon]